jgi:short-subunit dehydrogenase
MAGPLKKIALVTWAEKGIGFEAARQLAASGCSLLLGARKRGLHQRASSMCRADSDR